MDKFTPFKKQLTNLVNKHCKENGSDTPDFILARFMFDCLTAWDHASQHRRRWYGGNEVDPSKP